MATSSRWMGERVHPPTDFLLPVSEQINLDLEACRIAMSGIGHLAVVLQGAIGLEFVSNWKPT